MLEPALFADEGGERQAPLGVGHLYANGVANVCMECSMEDGLADARAEV